MVFIEVMRPSYAKNAPDGLFITSTNTMLEDKEKTQKIKYLVQKCANLDTPAVWMVSLAAERGNRVR